MTPDGQPRRSAEALAAYQDRWGRRLLVVSLLYLVVVLYEMLPGVKIGAALWAVDAVFLVVFIVDYVWRVFFLAPHPGAYARTPLCILDLIVILSFPTLFVFSVFFSINGEALGGILRVIAQGMRLTRVAAQGGRTVGQAHRLLSRRALRWIIPVAAVTAAYIAVYVSLAEAPHVDANMHGPGDAAWWAIVTVMTLGYGDVYPHTAPGRVAAVVLMLVGLVLIGWVTASLASWFVKQDDKSADKRLNRKLDEVSERLVKLDEMSERLAALEAHLTGNKATGDSTEESE